MEFDLEDIKELRKEVIGNIIGKLEEKISTKVKFNHKLTEFPTAPVFRRKHTIYQSALIIDEKREFDKGVLVEFFDLRNINEDSGIRPSELTNRAQTARKLGWQYFAIMSDQLEFQEQMIEKLIEVYSDTNNQIPTTQGRHLQMDYITYNDILKAIEDEDINISWYGLLEDREERLLMSSQDVNEYIRFKDENKYATRVYDFGILKNDY